MIWLFLLAAVIIGVIVVILLGRWNGAEPPREDPPAGGPDPVDELLQDAGETGVQAHHLETVEFDSSVRGYRMEQVDKLLDALATQLRQIDRDRGDSSAL